MERFLIANGAALRCFDSQRGEKVLILLHGYLESLEVFDDIINILKQSYRIIAIDLPGHGISSVVGKVHSMEFLADVLNDVLDQLEVDKCWVAGHSMGGYVATKFAQKYTDRCQGLIMIHSIFEGDTPKRAESRNKEIALIEAGKKDMLIAVGQKQVVAKQNRKKMYELLMNLEDQAFITEEEGMIAILNGIAAREDMTQWAKECSLPIICFWGEYDELIPLEYAQQLAQNLPKAHSYFMQNSGHISFAEEQERFIELIKTHLGEGIVWE